MPVKSAALNGEDSLLSIVQMPAGVPVATVAINGAKNAGILAAQIVGVATAVAVARFSLGLGRTTALTDGTPWGMWIGFDVLSGVALAAGGFVIAATVHVFRMERYHGIVRPAILTAFLGYLAVAIGLLYDLGLPWHIWHPMIHWQHHSVLFEVAWCVMIYFTVTIVELSPTVLEYLRLERLAGALHRIQSCRPGNQLEL